MSISLRPHLIWISIFCAIVLVVTSTAAQTIDRTRLAQPLGTDESSVEILDAPRDPGAPLTITLNLDGERRRILLVPHSVRAPDMRVRVGGGRSLRDAAPPQPQTYRGTVEGAPDSRVSAALIGDRFTAHVITESGEWTLQPANQLDGEAPHNAHVLKSTDPAQAPAATCAARTDDHLRPASPSPMPLPLLDGPLDVLVTEIAIDADVEFFNLNNGSIDDIVADIESVINAVSAIYERELRVSFQIAEIIIRTEEPDPYSATDPNLLLEQFRTQWVNHHGDVTRDVAQLFTGKDLDGTAIGAAWRGALCNFLSFSVAQSKFDDDPAKRAAISAHEIGHNFDAGHCDDADWWCRIMCSGIGGCSGYHSFSPWALGFMTDYAAESACLEPGVVTLPNAPLPFFDDFGYSGDPDPLRWEAVDGVFLSTVGGIEPSPHRSAQLNEYDTMRTIMLSVPGPAMVSFWVNPRGVESGKRLRVEYFDSTSFEWHILEDIISDGVSDSTFDYLELPLPPEGYGEFLMIRFTPWGPFLGYSDKWYVDDVRIESAELPGDVDGDGDIDLEDYAAMFDCTTGPVPGDPPAGCDAETFQRADLNDSGSVDALDYKGLQTLF